MKIVLASLVLGVAVAGAQVKPHVCAVQDYGAKGDGSTVDTAAIQKAIDDCAGGGTVVVGKAKKFVSGPLVLKSHIVL